jgi:hypothetical protein
MKVVQAAAIAIVVAGTASLLAQSGPRRDGKWEVTSQVEMSMPNMAQPMSMPPNTTTQCITPEDAKDPSKAAPQAPQGRRGGPPPDCKITDQKITGNTVSAKMTCTGDMSANGTMEMTYDKDAYKGKMVMNTESRGMAMTMTVNYTGKRLGDCTK